MAEHKTTRTGRKPPDGNAMSTTQWAASLTSTNVAHVYPVNDLRRHSLRDCWCRPVDDQGVILHNSLDGRESYETGARKPT